MQGALRRCPGHAIPGRQPARGFNACRRIGTLAALAFILTQGQASAQGGAAASASTDERAQHALEQAEAAFAQEDLAAAEQAYATVLEVDPANSRALYRLAQLRRQQPAAAVALLERYVEVMPLDPWGHLALATAWAWAGRHREALRAYDAALALEPEDRDIALGGPRLYARLGLTDRSIAAYQDWLAGHADDGEAWRELAEQLNRARRYGGARRAVERALRQNPGDERLAARLESLRTRTAPAFEFGLLGIGETDVNSVGGAAGLDAAVGASGRVGVTLVQRRMSSLGDVAQARRLLFRASFAPRSDLQVQLGGGVVWTHLESFDGLDSTRPELTFRLRRRPARAGLTVDLRAQHGPVDVTPSLAVSELMRSHAAGAIEAPVAARVLLRAAMRVAAMTRPDERNIGTRYGGGLAAVVAPAVHVSGQWFQSRYQHPALGYFAPRLTETIEAGLDLDRERGAVAASVDAGVGVQRVQRHGQEMGEWGPAFRAWGLVSWAMRPGRQLLVEFEAYDSQVTDVVTTAEQWRYASVTASFRLALR